MHKMWYIIASVVIFIVILYLYCDRTTSNNSNTSLQEFHCMKLDCDTKRIQRIPKKIYRIWLAPGRPSPDAPLPPAFKEAWDFTMNKNPEYEQILWGDAEVDEFMKSMGEKYYNAFQKICKVYGAARTDFIRYCIMYKLGGVYLDMKSAARPLCELIRPTDSFILSAWNGQNLKHLIGNSSGEWQQWWLASEPEHPIMKELIDTIVENIENYDPFRSPPGPNLVFFMTGPVLYTQTVNRLIKTGAIDKKFNVRSTCTFGNGTFIYDFAGKHNTNSKTHYTKQRSSFVYPCTDVSDLEK